MSRRKNILAIGSVHHVFTRSIESCEIFNDPAECQRMLDVMQHYKPVSPTCKFSDSRKGVSGRSSDCGGQPLVAIIAFCLMPTHLHLLLKQLQENGISVFMRRVLNSYTHYFNLKHGRRGPLWEGRFKNVPIENDGQLLHTTRYIHLNPVTASLVDKPEEWRFSSYGEFVGMESRKPLCDLTDVSITPEAYRAFVENRIDYQRELARIKEASFD